MEQKTTRRRIVGKREYIKIHSRRGGLNMSILFFGVLLVYPAIITLCLLIALVFIFANLFIPIEGFAVNFGGFLLVAALALASGSLTVIIYRLLIASIKKTKAAELEKIVLLTRANAAEIPVADSLVRASDKPAEQQQAVLLRAVTETQETPPEQLLRPVHSAP